MKKVLSGWEGVLRKPAAPEAKTLPHPLHNQLQGRSELRSFRKEPP